MNQRLGSDGKPAIDRKENPKAIERKQRLVEENNRAVTESAEPWTRAKIIRELKRIHSLEPIIIGEDKVNASLDLHGVKIPDGEDLSGLDLSCCNMHGLEAKGVSFQGTIFSGSNMHGAILDGCNLTDIEAEQTNLSQSCLCNSRIKFRRRESSPGKLPRYMSLKMNLSEACVEGCGLDIQEKVLTAAESKLAIHRRSEGYQVQVFVEQGRIRYFGPELTEVNVTGLQMVCRRKR